MELLKEAKYINLLYLGNNMTTNFTKAIIEIIRIAAS